MTQASPEIIDHAVRSLRPSRALARVGGHAVALGFSLAVWASAAVALARLIG